MKILLLACTGLAAVVLALSQFPLQKTGFNPEAAGDLDLTFNGTGKNRIGFGLGNDQFNGTVIQPDGKIVAVGVAADGSAVFGFSVARFNGDGSPDTTFDGDGLAVDPFPGSGNSVFHAVTIQPDGKIIAVGEAPGSSIDFAVARFNTDGTVDNTFDGAGIVLTSFMPGQVERARGVAVQPDGKIVVVGIARVNAASPTDDDFGVARYNTDGSLDTTFDGDGKVLTPIAGRFDEARSVAIQPDGKIIVAGIAGTTTDFAVVRYNTDGSLDTLFDGDGRAITSIGAGSDRAYAVLIQPDGKIVAVGSATSATLDFAAVRYNNDGTLDASFDGDGLVTTAFFSSSDEAYSAVLQPDGKIVAAGTALGVNNDFALARYSADGSLDTSFDGDGRVTTTLGTANEQAFGVTVQLDGRIVAAGVSQPNSSTDQESSLIRYNSNGSLDTTLDTDGRLTRQIGNASISADECDIQPDGKIVVTGTLSFGSTLSLVTARFNTNGTLDPTFDGDGRARTFVGVSAGTDQAAGIAVQPDSKILVAASARSGSFDNFAVLRYNPDGTLDTTFDTDGKVTTSIVSGNDQPWTIAVAPDGKILVAGRAANPFFQFTIVRYNSNGSLDTTFDSDGIVTTQIGPANANANITDIAIQSDGKIVAGGLAFNGANEDFAVARYNLDGSLDTTFDGDGIAITPIFSGTDLASSLAIQPDGKYVVAGFANNGVVTNFALVRYNTDGSLDSTFSGDGIVTTPIGTGSSQAYGLAIQSNGTILVSGWGTFAGNANHVVVRYNEDGTLDDSSFARSPENFGNGGIATVDISPGDINPFMKLQNDGKIVIAGTSGGLLGVARLQNDLAPTAAEASISGRVVDIRQRGISKVTVKIQDMSGNVRIVSTSSFGYFQIEGLEVGQSYLVVVSAKRYTFNPPSRVINLQDSFENAHFVGTPQ